jgi:hypothetical protein
MCISNSPIFKFTNKITPQTILYWHELFESCFQELHKTTKQQYFNCKYVVHVYKQPPIGGHLS